MNFIQRFKRASKLSDDDIIKIISTIIILFVAIIMIIIPIIIAVRSYQNPLIVEVEAPATGGIIYEMSKIQSASLAEAEPDMEAVENIIKVVSASDKKDKIKKTTTEDEESVVEIDNSKKQEAVEEKPSWNGEVLTRTKGVVYGPSGKETYYNLDMSGVIRIMNSLGFYDNYWVDDRGIKYFGDYIMIATDTNRYPKGTIMQTSLGLGRVVDHCESAANYSGTWLDLAVTW